MLQINYLIGAKRDFDESFNWYAKQNAQIAIQFVTAVENSLMKIVANPKQFSSIDVIHRECRIKKFPFRIVYRLVEDNLLIVAIAHAKRRPDYWRNRI